MSDFSESVMCMVNTLHDALHEVALAKNSIFEEPLINIMMTDKKKIYLTVYAPSAPLGNGTRNHEYELPSVAALSAKLDELITVAKSAV